MFLRSWGNAGRYGGKNRKYSTLGLHMRRGLVIYLRNKNRAMSPPNKKQRTIYNERKAAISRVKQLELVDVHREYTAYECERRLGIPICIQAGRELRVVSHASKIIGVRIAFNLVRREAGSPGERIPPYCELV